MTRPFLSLFHPSLLPLRFACSFRHILQCHAQLAVSGLLRHPFAASRLLALSSLLAPLPHTLLLLLRLPQAPDSFAFPPLAAASARAGDLNAGEALHSQALRRGVISVVDVSNSLIHMYSSCGLVGHARVLFDEMPVRDLVSWNSIVDGYVKVGDLGSAQGLFDTMPESNVVSWNIMINGYVKGRCPESGLELFREMGRKGVKGSVKTMVSMVTACGRMVATREGRSVHGYFIRNFGERNIIFKTALVDMYSKCKRVDIARKVFDGMSERNLVSWNAMILGHCIHACAQDGLALFEDMVKIGKGVEDRGNDYGLEIKPDETTFVGVLCACARAGFLDEGKKYFNEMTSMYDVKSTFAHHWCMANLYGSLGLVQEAEEVLKNMRVDTESLVWSTLLGSCRFHGDIELGEQIGKKFIELEPCNSSRYALLWNVYVLAERWDDIEKLKMMMKERGLKAIPGHTLRDLKEIVHNFKAGDRSRPELENIYTMMDSVASQLGFTISTLESNENDHDSFHIHEFLSRVQ